MRRGRLRLLLGAANSRFKIQNKIISLDTFGRTFQFGQQPAERSQVRPRTAGLRRREAAARTVLSDRFQLLNQPAAERTGLRRRGAALRPGAAACCGALWAQFRIQNSRFKITDRAAACGALASSTKNCGPPPPGGCGPLRPFGRKFSIQNSRFKINKDRLGIYSGRGLRRAQRRRGVAGLRRAEAAARRPLARSIFTQGQPAARRTGLLEQNFGTRAADLTAGRLRPARS